MNEFTISPTLNPEKVFILHKSEIEKRLDPSWYVYLRSIKGFKHKRTAFKNLLLEPPQYGANEIGIERTDNSKPRYIRITDINEFGELSEGLGKTASSIEEKYFLNANDLLLARSGNTVGKSYLHKNVGYDCFFAGYMIRFKIDPSKVLPEYIFAYTQTDFYKKWTKAIQRTTGQPNINAEEYKSLEIPLPDFSIQRKIIKIYYEFLRLKKQNDAEAEKLLSSVDDYLLKEVGIKLPDPVENNLKNRMYTVRLNEISGGRFDPKLHSLQTKALISSLYTTKFNHKSLRSVIIHSCSGDWGNDDNENYNETEFVRCLVIRATEFDNKFNLNVDGSRAKFRLINKLKYKSLDIQPRDLLIEKSGGSENQPVGRIAILTKELTENYSLGFSNFVSKIRVDETILNADYVFNYLKTIHSIKVTDVMQSQTNGIRNLILQEYFKLPISVPPLEKQKEIADTIETIKQNAKQLKDNTINILQKANKEIENILLN
jgi:restriction endonuclease S subunit